VSRRCTEAGLSDSCIIFLESFSSEGHLGSGSTQVGAGTNGRIFRGVELDPLYVDLFVRRFGAATGEATVLSATGLAFEALTARRALEAVPAFGVTRVVAGRSKRATGRRQGCHASSLAVDRALASPLPR
jgi:hypothetical protein